MYGNSGIRQYQQVSVETLTPERMIVMLYEGMFRFLESARRAIADGDIAGRTSGVQKAQAIISELKRSLNHDCGATFTNDLEALYNFAFNETVELLIDNDPVHIDNIHKALGPLHASWKALPEAMIVDNGEKVQAADSGPDPASEPQKERTPTRSVRPGTPAVKAAGPVNKPLSVAV